MNDAYVVSAWSDKPGKVVVYMKNANVYVFPTRHITFISQRGVYAGDPKKPLALPERTGEGKVDIGTSEGSCLTLYFDGVASAMDFRIAVTKRL